METATMEQQRKNLRKFKSHYVVWKLQRGCYKKILKVV